MRFLTVLLVVPAAVFIALAALRYGLRIDVGAGFFEWLSHRGAGQLAVNLALAFGPAGAFALTILKRWNFRPLKVVSAACIVVIWGYALLENAKQIIR